MTRKEKILAFFKDKSYTPLLFKELMSVLCVPKEDENEFSHILKELENEGYITKTKRKRYALNENPSVLTGEFRGSQKGFGFVTGENFDVFVGENDTFGALDGDTVTVKITKGESHDKKCEGRVIKIVTRACDEFVGCFEKSRNFGFVIADSKRIPNDIFISKSNWNKAKDGDKVVVKIIKWGDGKKKCEGKITEILGKQNANGVDVLSVMRSYNLFEEFDEDVLKSLNNISDFVSENDIEGRLDLRGENIITIDGDDAKDLDDAVSVKKTKDGFTLGVHIADVSHYVTENSALDREAFKRGTSVYLADRVIPMLPKKLSNGICSLNEKVDRLTLSVIMDIDENGNVKNHKIAPSVINSKHRMTYNNVYKIISGDKKLKKEYDDIYEMLKNMESLAHILHDKRMKKGGIDFNMPELKVKFDENGKVLDIYKYETNFANQIIEEFMLICNQTVAQHMYWQNIPFIYRTHDVPSEEKTRAFNEYIASMGFSIKHLAKPHPNQYAKLLADVKGTQYEKPIATSMLRSLMKAEYTPENKGHFGLAFEYYCHFTSPIRRYPDLAIHRIIKEYISGKMTQERMNYLSSFTKDAALRSSKTEVNAQNAERDVLDMKICEYMEDKVGEHFDATVSSVTSFGMFAELENGAEGLVRLADMNDDYYVFDEKHLCLVGERTKNVYKIGDKIRIVVKRVSKELKEIDFEPEE